MNIYPLLVSFCWTLWCTFGAKMEILHFSHLHAGVIAHTVLLSSFFSFYFLNALHVLGQEYVSGLSQSHFNPRQVSWAKNDTESGPRHMSVNISSIVLLFLIYCVSDKLQKRAIYTELSHKTFTFY